MMTSEQRDALRAMDAEERLAVEIEDLEVEHLVAEEAYLRRRDRLLGREIPALYPEIESARSLLHRARAERQKRFERRRMAVLTGHGIGHGVVSSQLDLLPE